MITLLLCLMMAQTGGPGCIMQIEAEKADLAVVDEWQDCSESCTYDCTMCRDFKLGFYDSEAPGGGNLVRVYYWVQSRCNSNIWHTEQRGSIGSVFDPQRGEHFWSLEGTLEGEMKCNDWCELRIRVRYYYTVAGEQLTSEKTVASVYYFCGPICGG